MDRIMRPGEVAKTLGVGRACLYKWISNGHFPRPLKLGGRSVGWRSTTIETWIDNRPEAQIADAS